jgi:hypothetical protein
MDFTDTQLEALYAAKVCAAEEKAFVPHDEFIEECDELVEAGWLTPEPQDNGDTAYAWSPRAEAALDLNNLMTPDPSRTN